MVWFWFFFLKTDLGWSCKVDATITTFSNAVILKNKNKKKKILKKSIILDIINSWYLGTPQMAYMQYLHF